MEVGIPVDTYYLFILILRCSLNSGSYYDFHLVLASTGLVESVKLNTITFTLIFIRYGTHIQFIKLKYETQEHIEKIFRADTLG